MKMPRQKSVAVSAAALALGVLLSAERLKAAEAFHPAIPAFTDVVKNAKALSTARKAQAAQSEQDGEQLANLVDQMLREIGAIPKVSCAARSRYDHVCEMATDQSSATRYYQAADIDARVRIFQKPIVELIRTGRYDLAKTLIDNIPANLPTYHHVIKVVADAYIIVGRPQSYEHEGAWPGPHYRKAHIDSSLMAIKTLLDAAAAPKTDPAAVEEPKKQ